jgi:uncharacterized protein with von Willebrand factor type A (vWA) domain
MADSTGFIAMVVRWFWRSPEYKSKKKSAITDVIERVAQAEERLVTVEDATINFTTAALSPEDRAEWEEANAEDEEDWF